MALLNQPMLRETICGWVVVVRIVSGTELVWGPYSRADAEAQARRLRKHPDLLWKRSDAVRAKRQRSTPVEQEGLFSE